MTNLKVTAVLTVLATCGTTAAFAQDSGTIAYTASPQNAACIFNSLTNGSGGSFERDGNYFTTPTTPATVSMDVTNMGSVAVQVTDIVGEFEGSVGSDIQSTDWQGTLLTSTGGTSITTGLSTGVSTFNETLFTDTVSLKVSPMNVVMNPSFQASNAGDYTLSFLVTCVE